MIGGLALVFAELAGCHAAWEEALRGWNVRQSQQVLEWQAEARREGELKGRAEGELKGRAEMVLHFLQRRTGAPVPADLAVMIRNTKDLASLNRWFDVTYEVTSLDEFRRRLNA